MSEHTPGPWEVHTGKINPLYRGIIGLGSEPNQEQPWAVVATYDINRPAYDIAANARLIAAAPDMLEALQNAVLQIEYLHEKFKETGTGNGVISQARAALAKAKGETK